MDKIDEAAKLMELANHFGPLHIVIEDGNMEDVHLDHAEGEGPIENWPEADRACLAALRALTVSERYEAYERNEDPDWRDANLPKVSYELPEPQPSGYPATGHFGRWWRG